jgi:hypothetical protein
VAPEARCKYQWRTSKKEMTQFELICTTGSRNRILSNWKGGSGSRTKCFDPQHYLTMYDSTMYYELSFLVNKFNTVSTACIGDPLLEINLQHKENTVHNQIIKRVDTWREITSQLKNQEKRTWSHNSHWK